jgi:hypothetical protein
VKKPFLAAFCVIFLLSSCIGVQSEINLAKDGSGTVKLEYRVAKDLAELGKLDGNERWLPLPAGRADMERTAARIPGLTLKSCSEKDDGKDIVISASLAFADTGALAAFFDASGKAFTVTGTAGSGVIRLRFPGGRVMSDEVKNGLQAALSGYTFKLSFTLPADASAAWFDESGQAASGGLPGDITVNGKTAQFEASMEDVVFLRAARVMEIRF